MNGLFSAIERLVVDRNGQQEGREMENVTQERVGHLTKVASSVEPDEGVRVAHSVFLSELPGAAFVGITLFWIISSLAGLMWRDMPAETIAHFQSLAQALLGSHALTMMSRVAGAATVAKTAYGFFDPRTPV
jgi:hypothetical protein